MISPDLRSGDGLKQVNATGRADSIGAAITKPRNEYKELYELAPFVLWHVLSGRSVEDDPFTIPLMGLMVSRDCLCCCYENSHNDTRLQKDKTPSCHSS